MPTLKQQRAVASIIENHWREKPTPLGKLLIGAGYSIAQSINPGEVIKAKGFQELLKERLSDDKLTQAHQEVLDTKRIEHMVFPLNVSDEAITELVESVGGKVRKFQHGDTATHVWFWVADGKLKLEAIKLGYALKGKLLTADKGREKGDTYNLTQQNINLNAPSARQLADETLKLLLEKTKRPVDNSTTDNTSQAPD